ncbi:hypothetical protein ACFDTO_23320 [Microbacteriaceae bacterium 4G12]
MSDWNEQAAPNNNVTSAQMRYAKKQEHEFSEELSDGGERNKIIQDMQNKRKK